MVSSLYEEGRGETVLDSREIFRSNFRHSLRLGLGGKQFSSEEAFSYHDGLCCTGSCFRDGSVITRRFVEKFVEFPT